MPLTYSQNSGSSVTATNNTLSFSGLDYRPEIGDTIEVYNDTTKLTETTDYTLDTTNKNVLFVVNNNALTFTPGDTISVYRIAKKDTRAIDFQNASVLTEADLDNSAFQTFHIAQEALDTAEQSITVNADGTFNANNERIVNLADPTGDQDAATKAWVNRDANTTTVAGSIANVNAVAGQITPTNNIATVADSAYKTDIETVADSTYKGKVETVADSTYKSKVETVADSTYKGKVETVAESVYKGKVETVADSTYKSKVETVADNDANVTTVAGIDSNVTTVAGISGNVSTVAGISSDVTDVANISTAVSAVNANASNINAVNSNSSNINTVAGNNSNITTVAGIDSNVTTVAGISGNVTTVATNNANVTTVAQQIADVNNFADTYFGTSSSASGPTGTFTAGDLYFSTYNSENKLKVYNGSSWQNATSAVEGIATITEFTPNGSDTHFAFTHDVGLQIVFLNGVRLIQGTDYNSVNSSSSTSNITSGTATHLHFSTPPANGDVLSAMGFGTVTSTAVVPVSGGTFSGNINVTGTVTADGLTVDGDSEISNSRPILDLMCTGATDENTRIDNNVGILRVRTLNDAKTTAKERLQIDNATGDISFYEDTGTTAKFHWDASEERLGIGTSPSSPLHINNAASSACRLYLQNTGNTSAGYTQIWSQNNDLAFNAGNAERLRIDSSGNVELKTTNADLILPSGGGISFQNHSVSGESGASSTTSDNVLDDYEEGTWTVTIIGSTTAGSHSGINREAWYVKTGALVTVGFIFEGTSGTGSGDMQISGLPFTPQYEAVSAIQWNSGLDLPTGTNTALMRSYGGSTVMQVRCNNDGTGAWTNMPYPTNPSYVRGAISYKTAS